MSLINQALKKEQQRRSLNLRETAADIPVYDSDTMGNGLSPSRQKKNASLSILLGLTGAGVVLLGLGGAFVYFGKAYLSGLTATSPTEEAKESPSFASNPLVSNPVNDILAENDDNPPASTPAEAEFQDESLETEGELAAAIDDQNPNLEIANASAGIDDDPTAVTEYSESGGANEEIVDSAPEEPQFDFKIQDFVDGLQVFGYRSAGANTRLLLGGRVFKLDDIVDNERGLIFRGSEGEYLIFEAPSGYLYKKPL